jgi:hypothetical protein
MPLMADQLAENSERRRHCILLWMAGGPSQIDTFDLKPRHANGGEFKETASSVPGIRISEHLPKLARFMEHLAIVRSLSTKEGDHGRGTYLMRTGHPPSGPVRYPTVGASISKELGSDGDELPSFVSIGPFRALNQEAFGPGFLGPRYAPLTVAASDSGRAEQRDADGYADLRVEDLRGTEGIGPHRHQGRLELWNGLQSAFLAGRPSASGIVHDTVYRRAIRLMNSEAAKAFDLADEPTSLRDAYGRGRFGQGCLMARRLLENGVSFVEVTLNGVVGGPLDWDTHQNNFSTVKQLSAELDAGWSTLMTDLRDRGLLESTTLLWMGEFGRTPNINANGGRDHFPNAWTCVFGGGGIAGGQVYGATSEDGMSVTQDMVGVGDVLSTLCAALGVNPNAENISDLGRPIRIAEGRVIRKLLS